MIAAAILLLLIVAAVAAPWVMPGDPYATSMFKRLKPIGTAGTCWAPTSWAATCSRA
jgi:peptide/nickel transport system permease protein